MIHFFGDELMSKASTPARPAVRTNRSISGKNDAGE
jgi:hypothetical protein